MNPKTKKLEEDARCPWCRSRRMKGFELVRVVKGTGVLKRIRCHGGMAIKCLNCGRKLSFIYSLEPIYKAEKSS